MKKSAAAGLLVLGAAVGAAGGAASSSALNGTVYVRFEQQLPDGGTRDLGRTGCYELGPKVKARVEPCTTSR